MNDVWGAKHGARRMPALCAKREAMGTLLFALIAAASVWAITAQARDFSVSGFLTFVRGSSAMWLALAAACMLLHILLEGCAILEICRSFGYPRRLWDGFAYASADIYFSAITPSATGGQPASAFFMMRDGIPGPVVTAALLMNLIMYTLSILVIGLLCFTVRPEVYRMFSPFARNMIALGCAIQCALALAFVLLLKKDRMLYRICDGALCLLARPHVLRRPEEKRAKLRRSIEEYRENVRLAEERRGALLRALVLNLLQRAALIAVTVCAFRAAGGAGAKMLDAWAVQGFSVLGSNFVPIPGAMGVADLMMLDGFRQLGAGENGINLELLSRGISFYGCVFVCGVATLVKYLRLRRQSLRKIVPKFVGISALRCK